MIICISGTPGTGKTTLAKKIVKDFRFKYIDGNIIIEKYCLSEGFDKKKDCKIVDVKKFIKAVLKEVKQEENYVIDSHLSHNLPKNEVDLCVICKCDLKKLKNRLEKRRYSKSKVRENLDAEIIEVCLTEAQDKDHKIIIYEKDYKKLKKDIKNLINA